MNDTRREVQAGLKRRMQRLIGGRGGENGWGATERKRIREKEMAKEEPARGLKIKG